MNPAQQEVLNNYTALANYYQGVANYAVQQSTTLPYFPDIANSFTYNNTYSDLNLALAKQVNFSVGSRINFVCQIQALQREYNMRATGKGNYAEQQTYIGVNDSNYWSYKAYADVYQFVGNQSGVNASG